jgi:hypothetical protein
MVTYIVTSSLESCEILFPREHGNRNPRGDLFHHTGLFFRTAACSRCDVLSEIFQTANTRYIWSKWHISILHMKACLHAERLYSPVILCPALWAMSWHHASMMGGYSCGIIWRTDGYYTIWETDLLNCASVPKMAVPLLTYRIVT